MVSEIASTIRLKPGSESLFETIIDVLERERPMTVPSWIEDAITKTIGLAIKERACAFPGNPADLCHGHLIIPKKIKKKPFNERMDMAAGILFHSQECLDAESYGLDPLRRNLFFDRQMQQVKILNPRKFRNVTPSLSIDPNDVRKGFMAGGTIFFKMNPGGQFTFCSWDNWPLTNE